VEERFEERFEGGVQEMRLEGAGEGKMRGVGEF